MLLISKVLTVYYDCSKDERVPEALYRLLKNYYTLLESGRIRLYNWGKFRYFEGLIAVRFIYARCGEDWLLRLAALLKAQGVDYTALTEQWKTPLNRWRYETHIVNLAMMLKAEALECALTGAPYTDRAEALYEVLAACNGTPVGLFTGDECLSGLSPIQGTELCAVVEQMYSYEQLYACTGDEKWLEPFDYVLGSAHFLPVGGDPTAYPTVDDSPETTRRFLAEAFDGDSDAAAECYFAQLRRVADAPRAQVVGHFDLLTKFDEKERFFDETSPRYRAAALNAMDALVSAGKVFEVNTGAISRGWRTTPYPSRWILEQLRRRNARVTISSDSHHAATVDCAFDDAQRLLEACGFEEIWAFDGRAFVKRRIKE